MELASSIQQALRGRLSANELIEGLVENSFLPRRRAQLSQQLPGEFSSVFRESEELKNLVRYKIDIAEHGRAGAFWITNPDTPFSPPRGFRARRRRRCGRGPQSTFGCPGACGCEPQHHGLYGYG